MSWSSRRPITELLCWKGSKAVHVISMRRKLRSTGGSFCPHCFKSTPFFLSTRGPETYSSGSWTLERAPTGLPAAMSALLSVFHSPRRTQVCMVWDAVRWDHHLLTWAYNYRVLAPGLTLGLASGRHRDQRWQGKNKGGCYICSLVLPAGQEMAVAKSSLARLLLWLSGLQHYVLSSSCSGGVGKAPHYCQPEGVSHLQPVPQFHK